MENFQGKKVSDRRKGRVRKFLLMILAILTFIIVLTLILAPGITKNYIIKNGKELTGRIVEIEKLKYNYFTSTTKIIGFKWFEQNDSDVFVAFDTLMINLKPLKLFNNEIYVQELSLVNPTGTIIQNDSVFNFNDLIQFYSGQDTLAAEAGKEETSYKLNLNNIIMKNGAFSYRDVVLNHTINFNKLYFDIPKIYWGEPNQSKVDVTFDLANGGHFVSGLDYNVEEGTYEGYARIEQLYLRTFLPYIQQFMSFSDVDGSLNSEINFSGSTENYEDFQVSGTFNIDSLKFYDQDNNYVIGGKRTTAVLNSSQPLRYQVNVDLIQMDEPYIYFALIDSTSNFEKMLVVTTPEAVSHEDSPSENSDDNSIFTINRFLVNKGLIEFSDQRFREEFFYELSDVQVDMDTLELRDNWVNINANMLLNKRGNLKAEMGLNPGSPLDSIQIDYVLSDFQLPDVNVYSKHYVGLPILFGDMYYVSKTNIVNKQLTSENELIIRNVEMGRKSGGLYDIPMKLALFILKDINGDINLDIPVRGDLSDPKTKLGPIIWNTLKSLMVKIVASPFKALGNLMGVDPKELEEITFDFADTTLVANQKRSLDLLLELEQKKPELQIQLQYYNDKKLERTDAAEELSTYLYLQEKGKKAQSNKKDYLKFLQEKTGQDSLLLQDYELLFVRGEMIDSVIQERELLRLNLTRNYLTEKNDSTTIQIFDYKKEEVLNIGSRPRFEIKYVLAEDVESR